MKLKNPFEHINDIKNEESFFLIAGPCVLESDSLSLDIAARLKEICERYQVPFIFKSSFDKANRTSGLSPRGPGMHKGLAILKKVRDSLHIPVLTDIHDTSQAEPVSEVADILQIPAFLCRQTDLLIAAGRYGNAVNIKKGQFMSPEDMKYALEKVNMGGDAAVTLTERGTFMGYRNLVLDLRSLAIMRNFAPVVFDATHSVQSPGGLSGISGGNREFVPLLVRGAIAAGIDGLFLEVHTDPDSSPSDAASMITPEILEQHLPGWIELDKVVREQVIT
ncbi:MAG: 3-deoxy-8-phosphooctulonate synthase [Candidatus Electryonea clarkiae]|nr:3-deoxy-8-phosphooctulonate synthase [Candidatus Electryonea clarkiae]MDP8288094.1 3-deoxy-8-phosphooctulonate synthase [Candidatus Electryonea clarkiae]